MLLKNKKMNIGYPDTKNTPGSPLKCIKPPCIDVSKIAKKIKGKKARAQDTLKLPPQKENESKSDYNFRVFGNPGVAPSKGIKQIKKKNK